MLISRKVTEVKSEVKKFIKDLRQDFVSYLQPFSNISSKIALSLATLTSSKTRFCSHINFIGRCLNFKVIPKGFRTNFHASNFSISCNRYFQDIDQACNTFSKKRHESHYQSNVNQTPRN